MSDDNEMSAEMPSELVRVLWETLAELYGSASVYPSDDIRRMAHDIVSLRAERDELREFLKEVLDNPDEIWGEVSARIDAALKASPGDR